MLGDDILEPGDPVAPLVITFIVGAQADGGDADPNTFGIPANSSYEIEGEFVNVFGLGAAGSGDLATHEKAFVYQNVTSLTLLGGSLPLLATTYDRFMLDGGFDPMSNGLPDTDSDGDGVKNAIEWVIGGVLGDSDVSKLPVASLVSADPGAVGTASEYLLFTYRRNIAAHADPATSVFVTHGTDLADTANWDVAAHGVDGVLIEEIPNAHEIGMDEVRVYIPWTAEPEGRRFARLNVVIGEAPVEGPEFDASSGDFSVVVAGTFGSYVAGVFQGSVTIQETAGVDLAWNGMTVKANKLEIFDNGELDGEQWNARATDGSVYILQRGESTFVPPLLWLPVSPFIGQTWTNDEEGEIRELEVISLAGTSPGGIEGCVVIRETNPGDWSEDIYFKDGRFVGNTRTDLTGIDPDEEFYLQLP